MLFPEGEEMYQIKDLNMTNLPFMAGNASGCACPVNAELRYFEEGTVRRRGFLTEMLGKGLRAKIAYRDQEPVGFIEYYPIEIAAVAIEGEDLMVIACLDVKELRQGIGDALMRACIKDCQEMGRKGIAVIRGDQYHMPKAFFERYGFVEIDQRESDGLSDGLMVRKFISVVEDPKYLRVNYTPKLVVGKLVIDLFHSDQCPFAYSMSRAVKVTAEEWGDQVVLNEYNTNDRVVIERFGMGHAVFLNGHRLIWDQMVSAQSDRDIERFLKVYRNKLKKDA